MTTYELTEDSATAKALSAFCMRSKLVLFHTNSTENPCVWSVGAPAPPTVKHHHQPRQHVTSPPSHAAGTRTAGRAQLQRHLFVEDLHHMAHTLPAPAHFFHRCQNE